MPPSDNYSNARKKRLKQKLKKLESTDIPPSLRGEDYIPTDHQYQYISQIREPLAIDHDSQNSNENSADETVTKISNSKPIRKLQSLVPMVNLSKFTAETNIQKFNKESMQQVEVNENYLCQMPNGHWMQAQVLETRINPLTNVHEYYVHFEGVDRRLDQWIDINKIDTSSEKPTKILTNQFTNEQAIHSDDNCSESAKYEICSSTNSEKSNSKSDSVLDKATEQRMTRHRKRLLDDVHHIVPTLDEMDPITASLEREHNKNTKVKYIDRLIYSSYSSKWVVNCWYFSPYPDVKAVNAEQERLQNDPKTVIKRDESALYYKFPEIFVCAHTLRFFNTMNKLDQYMLTNTIRQPPGRMIYSSLLENEKRIAVYEIDGMIDIEYCQHLCLVAKLFLDHKTLYYDVEPFIFYILCEVDRHGATMAGYFSKEKDSVDNNNLACIMVLPPFQRKGYGNFIIDLSYHLSKKSGKIGSPERPLSDLGKVSYRSYWEYTLLYNLKQGPVGQTIQDLVDKTGISEEDVIETMRHLNLTKLWKGQHSLENDKTVIDAAFNSYKTPKVLVQKEFLFWRPPDILK